jgi:hypothetical protein
MMSCKQYRDKLNEYVDGRGPLPEHVSSCAECSRVLDELQRVRAMVGSLQGLPVPSGFRGSVMDRISSQHAKHGFWRNLRAAMWARTAFATVVVAGVAITLVLNSQREPQVPTVGDNAVAAMAQMHNAVQLAAVLPSDSPAPRGEPTAPAKDDYDDLYQVDGL